MRRIAALSLVMRSRSAAFSCLSSSELFNRPPSPTRRVTGFEPTCRAPCAGPNQGPAETRRCR